ncbi:MAG: Calx-beta domain-containing protein [Acidimicrobiales bacterium]
MTLLLLVTLGVPLWASSASAGHTATCRADTAVEPGEPMIWRALPSGGSGNYTYSWSSPPNTPEPVSGSTAVVVWTYSSAGWREARVAVRDQQSGDTVSADCGMNVVPDPLPEPPTVNPVLWVPNGSIDPSTIVSQLDRVWRSIRAEYYFMYGRTFVLNPIRTIVSSRSEFDICGGDCTDQGTVEDPESDTLMYTAMDEARSAVGVIPYARGVLVMAWGAGGFAGAWSWDRALGGVGDWSFAGPAGVQVPHLEARFDTPPWVVDGLGQYRAPIACSVAHELNHLIGWDDPHDFCLGTPPTAYERQVVDMSPWMTVTPSDTTRPTVAFSPSTGLPIGGAATIGVEATDAGGMDAVVLLIDGVFHSVDTTAPYSFSVDTTRLNFGPRALTAIAYDLAGNTSETTRPVTISNVVSTGGCSWDLPVGVFHACFFDGIGTTGPSLGTLLDAPSWRSDNVAIALDHDFSTGVAFGQTDTFTGVWRGQFDFPPENYRFRFDTDDGLRVFVNGSPVIDAWYDQVGYHEAIVPLSGWAAIEVHWYENEGGEGLRLAWGPTMNPPPGMFTISADVDGRGGVTASPGGISCGVVADCYESFPSGQTVTLTPTPLAGAAFVNWSGHPDCTDGVVIADDNKRCVATFEDESFLSVSDSSVTEGNSGPTTASITINRSGAVATPATVNWSTLDGTASAPTDYVAVPLTRVDFAPGETTRTVEVTVNGDTAVESNETFSIRLAGAVRATIADGSGLVRINNDDSGSFAVNDASVTEGDAGTRQANFTISRSGAVDGPATVKWSTLDAQATASSGDFVAVPATTVSFSAGETAKTVSVAVNGDTAMEINEIFYVRLSAPTGATIFDASGLGRITNDDIAYLAVNDITFTEGDSGTKVATFTISRSGALGASSTIKWATADGTATAGANDYVPVGLTTVTFAPGETTKPATITIRGDAAVEPNETMYVRLSVPVGAVIADGSGAARITNDDSASFSVNDATVIEGNAGTKLATFTITRSGAIGGPGSVQWYTTDGTAAAPGDYATVGLTTVTFAPGETTKAASVTVRGDTTVEGNETFSVRLTGATGGAVLDGSGLGRINNDD